MQITVICQPGAQDTHWCSLYLKGAYQEAKRKGDTLCLLTIEDFSALRESELPTVAAILATSRDFAEKAADLLAARAVKSVILGGEASDRYRSAGYVYMDYCEATHQFMEYLHHYGKNRIALFAVNLDSATDMMKQDAFLSCDGCREQDVFYYTGRNGLMHAVCERFLAVCRNYDAVICANDAAAIILLHHLEEIGVRVPESIFLCAFGDMAISNSGSKTLTLARLNCPEIGRQAVFLCRHLHHAESISGISVKIHCEFVVGDTTAALPAIAAVPHAEQIHPDRQIGFHSDPGISRIFQAESILGSCDAVDMDILRLIIKGYPYFDIAEILHVSESTVKYRLKRLLTVSGFGTRDELLSAMKAFLI